MYQIQERLKLPISFDDEVKDLKDYLSTIKYKTCNYRKQTYINLPFSFDIETTSYYDENKNKCATMYVFVLGVNERVFVGRTWDDLKKYLDILKEFFKVTQDKILIIYVHNLAYEFQFIRKLFKWNTVFAISDRQVAYCLNTDGFMFKCSYILSGYSLAKVGEHLTKYKISKKVGDLDYHLRRGSKTPLTKEEWNYVFNDGSVVLAYIQEQIEKNNNKICDIPLTKTSYVRRYIRKRCLFNKNDPKVKERYRQLMSRQKITTEEYKFAKRAFMGGFTHANVFNSNKIMTDVVSEDFTSSYPAVMVREQYPNSRGQRVEKIEDEKQYLALSKTLLIIGYVLFVNLESLNNGDDLLSISKCSTSERCLVNNGRIISCDWCITIMTNVDYMSVRHFYKWNKVEFRTSYIYTKNYLPRAFVKAILDLYRNKTKLKGVKGKEVEYMNSKEQLNSCYGRCVTDICRDEIIYSSDNNWIKDTKNIDKDIERYNQNSKRFLSYIWGVFVTAYARRNLYSAIYELKDDYIYSDTDSVKFINYEKHKRFFELYNQQNETILKKVRQYQQLDYELVAPKTIQGKTKVIGNWDFDGYYKQFKTLGAKRYIGILDDDSILLTISGVAKKEGIEYLKYKYKTNDNILKNFKNFLEFPALYYDHGVLKRGSGKECLTYIDHDSSGTFTDYLGYNNTWKEESSVFMEETSYNLTMTQEYLNYIFNIHEIQ